jgi:hypothetical protein
MCVASFRAQRESRMLIIFADIGQLGYGEFRYGGDVLMKDIN